MWGEKRKKMTKSEREKQESLEENFSTWRKRNIKALCLKTYGIQFKSGKSEANIGQPGKLWDFWKGKSFMKIEEREKLERKKMREKDLRPGK